MPLLLDGGVSSRLEQLLGPLHPQLWSAAAVATAAGTAALKQVHRDFLEVGEHESGGNRIEYMVFK